MPCQPHHPQRSADKIPNKQNNKKPKRINTIIYQQRLAFPDDILVEGIAMSLNSTLITEYSIYERAKNKYEARQIDDKCG